MNLRTLVAFRQTATPCGVHVTFKDFSRSCLLATVLFVAGTAEAITYSGRVMDQSSGTPVQGVRINYSWAGAPGFVTTDANGNWSSSGWINVGGSVTFTPDQSGLYAFSPGSRSYTIGFSSVSDVNFTRISYSISGTVRVGGVGVPGVTLTV